MTFPSGSAAVPSANLLVNPAFQVNQRAFAGGQLAAGAYGFDRWRAGAPGCNITRAADGTMTLTGPLEQVVEAAQASAMLGVANFAGRTLTLSVEDPTTPLPVTIGAKSATIPAGAGRRSATVTLDAGETGNLTVRLNPSSACAFRRVKLEAGPVATAWIGQPLEWEEFRCRRYYQRLPITGGSPAALCMPGQRVSSGVIDIVCPLPVPMRANPVLASSGFSWTSASPVNNQVGFLDNATGAWAIPTGGISFSAVNLSATGLVLRMQAGSSFSGSAGNVGFLHLGSSAFIGLNAEL